MPACAEAIVLMLALTRIGAIHLVVFAGFGSGALGDRIQLAGARAVFCADVTYRKGKDVPLKGIVDAALENAGTAVESVVILRRGPAQTTRSTHRARDSQCRCYRLPRAARRVIWGPK